MENIRGELDYKAIQKYKVRNTPVKSVENRRALTEINYIRYLRNINSATTNMMHGHMYLTKQMEELKNNVTVDLGKIKKKAGVVENEEQRIEQS